MTNHEGGENMTTPEVTAITRRAVKRPKVLGPDPSEKKRHPRTAPLPGMDEPRIEEIREAALKFFDLHGQKESLGKREAAAKQELLDAMHANKLKRYFDTEAEILVEIEEAAEKIRVTVGKEDEG